MLQIMWLSIALIILPLQYSIVNLCHQLSITLLAFLLYHQHLVALFLIKFLHPYLC